MAETTTTAAPETAPAAAPAETTFTQAQVEEMIGKRLARAMKGMPSDDELGEFRAWKAGQGAAAANLAHITQERDANKAALDAANEKIAHYEHERLLREKGVGSDDLDYYEFKISQLVNEQTTFEQAAEDFLKDHAPGKVRVSMTAPLSASLQQTSANDAMNQIFRNFRK